MKLLEPLECLLDIFIVLLSLLPALYILLCLVLYYELVKLSLLNLFADDFSHTELQACFELDLSDCSVIGDSSKALDFALIDVEQSREHLYQIVLNHSLVLLNRVLPSKMITSLDVLGGEHNKFALEELDSLIEKASAPFGLQS